MPIYRCLTMLALAAVLLAPRAGLAWTLTLRDIQTRARSATLPDGDVVSGLRSVVRLAAETGQIVWRTMAFPGYFEKLAVGAGGELYAVGVADFGSETCEAVWRIDPATGVTVWKAQFPSPVVNGCVGFSDVTLDGAGNLVLLGWARWASGLPDNLVVKLDGVTGAELWRYYGQPGVPSPLQLDGQGNVYVGISGTLGSVVRLDAATGVELARYSLTGGLLEDSRTVALATDAAGMVFVAGSNASTQAVVTKLDPSTGSEVWQKQFGFRSADAVAVDDAGDAYVYESSSTFYPYFSAFEVVKLSGTDGSVAWQTALPGVERDASGVAIALDSETNEIVVADEAARVTRLRADSGLVTWQGSPMLFELGAISLDGEGRITASGAVASDGRDPSMCYVKMWRVVRFSDRLTGRSLRFVDPPANPAGRSLRVRSNDALTLGLQVSAATDPSRDGGTLTVRNPDSGESVSFPLPARYWSTSGSSFPWCGPYSAPRATEPRWTYRDRGGAAGPCKSVIIRNGQGIKVDCAGSSIPAFLDEPSQGRLEISLTLGTGNGQWQCMVFGGDVKADRPGAFIARDAPRPAACPGQTTP
jgi:outer membrane protein assembly factor BamB